MPAGERRADFPDDSERAPTLRTGKEICFQIIRSRIRNRDAQKIKTSILTGTVRAGHHSVVRLRQIDRNYKIDKNFDFAVAVGIDEFT